MSACLRLACVVALAGVAHAQSLLRIADIGADGIGDVVVSTDVPGHELLALSAASGAILWGFTPPPDQRAIGQPGHRPRLAFAPDLDGDRRDDFAAAWIATDTRTNAQHVVLAVHSSRSGEVLASRDFPTRPKGSVGCELEAVGDTNGDGVPDFLLAHWFWGSRGPIVEVLSGIDLRTLHVLEREPRIQMHTVLRGLGDIDGDGCADFSTGFIVWTPEDDALTGATRDRIDVRSGVDLARIHGERIVQLAVASSYSGVRSGTFDREWPMGSSDEERFALAQIQTDHSYVLVAGDLRTGIVEQLAILGDSDLYWDHGGVNGVRVLPDFDGDGRDDYAFAMPGYSPHGRGQDCREIGCIRVVSADGTQLAEWSADAPFARLGTAFEAAGDVDRDGVLDVWAIQLHMLATPEVLLISGATGARLHQRRLTTW